MWWVLDDIVRRNTEQPEIIRLYTILGVEALVPEHPAHAYFRERVVVGRERLAEAARGWHPRPEEFAVEVLACTDGLQLQWLRDPGLDLVSLWRAAAQSLSRPAG